MSDCQGRLIEMLISLKGKSFIFWKKNVYPLWPFFILSIMSSLNNEDNYGLSFDTRSTNADFHKRLLDTRKETQDDVEDEIVRKQKKKETWQ